MNSLKQHHTFHIDTQCDNIYTFSSDDELLDLWQQHNKPKLILGGGSNVLFIDDFQGDVFINNSLGIKIREDDDYFYVCANGGERWHSFVETMLANGIYGLENLALIYGSVGAAPIQNIGAYGSQLSDFCEKVKVLNLTTGEYFYLSNKECAFGYRESVFKHQFKDDFFISQVYFKFAKKWQANTAYAPLCNLKDEGKTPQNIFDLVVKTREQKLPNPDELGNAGSFFKNPTISYDEFEKLQQQYPNMPHYPSENGVKLAAAWLIDNAGLKGFCHNDAMVHNNQPLVLVNKDNAKGYEIVELASMVHKTVFEKFAVELNPEVRFIGSNGEIDSTQAVK